MQTVSNAISQASFAIGGAAGASPSVMSMRRHSEAPSHSRTLSKSHISAQVTPFKTRHASSVTRNTSKAKGKLSHTIDHLVRQRSNGSIGLNSSLNQNVNNRSSNASLKSLEDKLQSMSRKNAAQSILEEKQRLVRGVRDGYLSSEVFEHTIADVVSVLEHRLQIARTKAQ